MKYAILFFAIIAVAYAGIAAYHDGGLLTSTGYQAPSFHAPWASSVDTGIRRFGSTAGFIAPAYHGIAAVAAPVYHHGHHYY